MSLARRCGALPCLLLFALASTAAEEAAPDDQAETISEIVVTATRWETSAARVPASIAVIAGEDVQHARQQLALDEAMAGVPGVFFQNRYNFAQDLRIAIRGFGARSNFGVRGIRILIDDIPETLPDGQSQVDGIDLASVGQVEVLRGPASALYGNAAGGVINIRSELGTAEPFVDLRAAAGDYGYRRYQLKTAASSGRIDYLVSLSDLQIDGYRAHGEAENTQLNSRLRLQLDEQSDIGVTFGLSDQPVSNDPGGLTRAEAEANPRAARDRNLQFDAGEALEQQKLGFVYSRTLGNGAKLQARNYYLHRDFSNRLPFSGGGIVAFDRLFAGGGVSWSRPFELGGYRHRFIAGIDYDRQRDDRQRYDNNDGSRGALVLDQVERITGTGLYLQHELAVSDALALTLGLRYDSIDFDIGDAFLADGDDSGSRTLSDLSPSAGFVFDLRPGVAVYGSVATAFETPTSTEFANPDGSGGFNQGLEPQQSTSYELGLRSDLGATARYEITAFNIAVDDELIPFEIATSPGRDFFANAGKSSRRGLELSVVAEPVAGLRMALAYTLSDFEFERFIDDNGNNFSGNTIPGIPDTFAHADLRYQHESGFSAGLDVLYSADLFADNANTASIDGATIANIRLAYETVFDQLVVEPFLGVNNLTDTSYTGNVRINAFGGRYFEPGPERNIYGGVSFRYRYSE